ncbi:aspartate/tyrosine/aromatic aminotransferase [Providencia rettgeri]|uniref:Aspartate/tyrosine/aromatic aminotransferase n=1 Tax=Alcaligenes parafaecalis TaxID=171260 RepID=A0ABT3VLI6_9BURK|nr:MULTISPECIES: amino acid aminotransferase [Alcaligenes]MBY6347578.1 aspartate/tyrosine/aromatic aminotransferase [Providencia rettgeri]MCX5463966.1 aspartate/tyrosine/aromatic aminotransferase [Alcaligenes parafaecalis]QTB98838.1 aspartate/tyrosine/aromatic aminotransferase [Alcaligenes sp. SORT26]
MFEHLQAYGGDPIFRLNEAFHADPRDRKVNLTIGLYYDEQGRLPLLDVARRAEEQWASKGQPRGYLPIEGLASYRSAVQKLVFGADSKVLQEGRVATIQTLGGSGALKVGGDFLHDAYPNSEMWISDPAWDNHHSIFRGSGIPTHTYRYYDPATRGLDFTGLMEDISVLPEHSIVLLHPCCHNPTGADLSDEQWLQLIPVLQERKLIPFLDMAYQGFGRSLDDDAFAVRAMVDAGLTFLLANSFSKNFSYYSERCGGLSVVCKSADEADRVLGQLKAVVRRIYSNPPSHGGQAIATILSDESLLAEWTADVEAMRQRIAAMRKRVHDRLKELAPQYDSSYFVKQQGMFCYTGLTKEQIQKLRDDFGVYVLESGRISVPGLNQSNVDYFAESLAAVVA